MHLHPGTLLQGGKYRIEQVLGQGGFGITYKAYDLSMDTFVAVKEFFIKDFCDRGPDKVLVSVPSSGSRDAVDKYRAKFLMEARRLFKLNHKHIVRVYNVFEENGTAYYVMEYLSGGSLNDRIPSGGLPESEAVRCIGQVAEAIAYIHGKELSHLDIKPSNIMFREDGDAVLIDFGISKHYDESGDETSSTPVGISEGYAPAEQYRLGGVSRFSPATDIYSLGATLYKLLTGQRPVGATSRASGEPLNPLPSAISPSVRQAVSWAMELDKSKRPQTVEEFVRLLSFQMPGEVREEAVSPEEDTVFSPDNKGSFSSESKSRKPLILRPRWSWVLAIGIIVCLAGYAVCRSCRGTYYKNGVLHVKGVDYPMVYVSGGSFDMGATSEQGEDALESEKPVHRVALSSYSIGKYEVTQDLWEAVMGTNPSYHKGARNPVEQISKEDCLAFISKLNKLTGEKFRLPTEAEWEFAARGGIESRGYKYSGSNMLEDVAWFAKNSGGFHHEVGAKLPNELGIYDMSGNVWERCRDVMGGYSAEPQIDPKGPAKGYRRVFRGGCFFDESAFCRVATRDFSEEIHMMSREDYAGFRLCL